MTDQASPEILAGLREALEVQISANDPPETAATLKRLRREGIEEDTAWRLLSAVLLQEMSVILRDGRKFDRAGYIEALRNLPELTDR